MIDASNAFLFIMVILVSCAWVFLSLGFKEDNKFHTWRWINRVVVVLSLILIVSLTLLDRGIRLYCPELLLFHSDESSYLEMYEHMYLNAILFFPLGLSLPFAIKSRPGRHKHIVFDCFMLSLVIELLQYLLRIGKFEANDLLMNTFGGLIGCIPYWIYKYKRRYCKSRRRHRKL